jgi:hypothetical protein
MNDLAQRVMRHIFSAVASFFSFLIAALLGYFGQKFSEFHQTDKVNRSLLPHSVQKFHLMNLILVAIFVLRGVLIIFSATNYGNFPSDTEVVTTNSHSHVTHLEMIYFLITEIIPCTFVLVTLWQPLCPKPATVKKSIDDVNLNHSEMNAKYNDMFSPRGSQISRDGDDVVRVIYSTGLVTTENNPLGGDDVESPSHSVCLSPMASMHKQIGRVAPEPSPQSPSCSTQDQNSLPPRMPTLPICIRPANIPPHLLRHPSDDNVAEGGRPSDANDLQYFHPDLGIDQIAQNSFSYSSSDRTAAPSPALHPQPSASSSVASGNGGLTIIPSSSNWGSWLTGSDTMTTPPLHRPPSTPSAGLSGSYYSTANSRTTFSAAGSSPRGQIVIASSDEKAQLAKQYGNVLSVKYILQRFASPPSSLSLSLSLSLCLSVCLSLSLSVSLSCPLTLPQQSD